MHFGRQSSGDPKNMKWGFIALGILIGILLLIGALVYLFFWIVHPLLIGFVIPVPATDVHMGVNYFEDGSYLSYEYGARFDEALGDSGYLSCGDVVDFYHVDNRMRDNPLYGKMSDVFAVDIQLDPEDYVHRRDEIVEDMRHCSEMSDYELYLYHADPGRNDAFLVAFCDEKQVLRCILAADVEVDFIFDYSSILIRRSGLDWFASDER